MKKILSLEFDIDGLKFLGKGSGYCSITFAISITLTSHLDLSYTNCSTLELSGLSIPAYDLSCYVLVDPSFCPYLGEQ